MSLKNKSIILMISLIALLFVGCQSETKAPETPPASESPAAVESKGLEVFGRVKGEAIPMNFDLELKIVDKVATSGDLVGKGDPLFTIDLQRLKQMSELKALELKAAGQKAGTGDITVSKLKNDLRDLELSLENKKQDLTDQQKLYAEGMVAKTELTALETEIRTLETSIANTRLGLMEAAATDSSAAANDQVARVQSELSYADYKDLMSSDRWLKGDAIVCPYDKAIVQGFEMTDNSYTTPKKPILELIDISTLYIEAEVSEEFIQQVKVGMPVEVRPLFDKEKVYHGTVVSISSLPFDKNGETIVPIRVELTDADEALLPNFNVDVKILTENK